MDSLIKLGDVYLRNAQNEKLSCIANAVSLSLPFILLERPKCFRTKVVEYIHKNLTNISSIRQKYSDSGERVTDENQLFLFLLFSHRF